MKKKTAAALAAGTAALVLCTGSVWGMTWAYPDGSIVTEPKYSSASTYDRYVVEEKPAREEYEMERSGQPRYSEPYTASGCRDDWYCVEEDAAEAVADEVPFSYDYEGEETCTIEQEAVDSSASVYDRGREKKVKEYEENGISIDKFGSWLWEGKQVYLLLDEDGSLSQNGSREATENKIYLIVKRKEDGTIREVVQVSVEDVMKEWIRKDLIKEQDR